MRTYRVNGVEHEVYESEDEVPIGLETISDWRYSRAGDWVRADDGCIIQVLRQGKMTQRYGRTKVRGYVGTCTGTFLASPKVKMDTSRRVNIYTIGGGKRPDDILLDRTKLTRYELVFVQFLASGMSPTDAYLKAYPTNNRRYALHKSSKLVKTERVLTAMKEELKPICKDLGIDEESVLKGIKDEADTAEKADTRLKALFKLSDILDLEDKNQVKITQVSGALFQGFTPEALEDVQRPELEEVNKDDGSR